jgi:futalosine hydrolase
MEVAPIVEPLRRVDDGGPRLVRYAHAAHDVDVLLAGVGMVATAAWTSRALSHAPYDLALNVGVCGSFDRELVPGTTVHVVADRLAELGAEDGDTFLTVQDLALIDDNEFPFTDGELVNPDPPNNDRLADLPTVRGITVNTVHGNERTIEAVAQRFTPQVESMEGAAFMFVCLIQQVRFAQVRAVSNVVERRNRGAWRVTDAVAALGATVNGILDTL